MTNPKVYKQPDTEQSKRFIEAARELGTDETGEEFKRAFAKIVPPKKNAEPTDEI